jgi:hypothetical protein
MLPAVAHVAIVFPARRRLELAIVRGSLIGVDHLRDAAQYWLGGLAEPV